MARVLSMGKTHRAIPLTIALNLGAASRIPGTIPASLVESKEGTDTIIVGHPSGRLEVGAHMSGGQPKCASLHRTARALMRGEVYWQ